MGNLPACRVTPARCFLRVGLDFGGSIYLKTGTRRNASSVKAYICLFVCMATKALHLELVSSLSADAFVAALDRFLPRRGLCEEIFSDNGTNFVGADNYLGEVYTFLEQPENIAKIRQGLAPKKLSWNFNPPAAPHFGGIFEAGLKSVKYHLKRVIGEQKLTFEEYSTVLIKIEAF
nr:PREDICTED: uncharacterized protein LOC109040037 [Bemisia tabaci]